MNARTTFRRAPVLVALLVATACGDGAQQGVAPPAPTAEPSSSASANPRPRLSDAAGTADSGSPSEETSVPSTTPSAVPTATPTPPAQPEATPTSPRPTPTTTVVPVIVERRTVDDATADFIATTMDVLTDERGWSRAGFVFENADDAPYRIVLAEGHEVDELCKPYDTYGRYSCQNGPTVALNADRWRSATPQWTGSLADYRIMLVNHEVGHLLHLHHPRPQCPGEGWPAPIMMQQSTELGACTANPWPLPWEVDLAAQRREPLAPPADHDVSDHRPSPPPQRHDDA